MITIKNVQKIDGSTITHTIPSSSDTVIDGSGLTLLPGLIDPHVHFRVPGAEHKENWQTGAAAAIAGGVTTVFDMPNNTPAITTLALLQEKNRLIEKQLQTANIPLRYRLYLGGTKNSIDEIRSARGQYIGIKVFLGQSTGTLLMDDKQTFFDLCKTTAGLDAVVAIHAEDDAILKKTMEQRKQKNTPIDVSEHSTLRPREAAIAALHTALEACEKYGIRLYLLHTSTKEEVEMIRAAKQRGLRICAETTPHHLFLNETAYSSLGTLAQMNPPLRTTKDQNALWEALHDGTIDDIGTDHAPHTLEEKQKPYGEAPSGVPGVETLLPLLLTAYHEGKISLETIVKVTRTNIERFFHLPPNDDIVLVDLNKKKIVRNEELKTKCGWSPFNGWELTGWPVYTIINGQVFEF